MLNKYGIRRTEKRGVKMCQERNGRQDVKSACQKRGGMDEIRQLLSRRESASKAHGVLYGGGGKKTKMRTSISARCENHQGQRHQSAQEIRK